MKIYKTTAGIVVDKENNYFLLTNRNWDEFINREHLYNHILTDLQERRDVSVIHLMTELQVLAPISSQEVWAAGVTYLRSREARMEESKDAGGGDFYAKVYEAERPELFFKSVASKVVGTGGAVRIRKDSAWNVPEPELTLFIASKGTIEGYTIGNDMSSRDIEGENPLYLPQAKVYDGAAALGPCLYIPPQPIDPDTGIHLQIKRSGTVVFSGDVSINRIKRNFQELVMYLCKETSFPQGVFLMTGTGIVPPDDFTLQSADEISITIDGIGTLINNVQ